MVTGASGFVGRALVGLLRDRVASGGSARPVTLVVRDLATLRPMGTLPPGWSVVRADLAAAPFPADTVSPGSAVLHLAAATGRLSRAAMCNVNVEGTRRVAEAARLAGASHFVFVSSVAAGFRNRRWYHYAEAKRAAERLVSDCGVPFTIVRPTMVFGPGSPVQEGLQRIASGGLPLVPGTGGVLVQPIHVEDLAAFLIALADGASPTGGIVDVGGGDRCTMRALLGQMRAADGRPPRRLWPVPLSPIRLSLAATEAILGPRLPVTAGQLASFVNDSVAAPNEFVGRLLPHPRGLAAMLADAGATAPLSAARPPEGKLAREFGILARYLGTATPDATTTAAYVRAHASVGAVSDPLDAWLVAVARRSTLGCALADAYARLARPRGALRRKLVLAMAVLESTRRTHADYDTALSSSLVSAWLALVALGTAWAARTVVALVVFAPLHLAARASGRGPVHG